jgi:hypothetical protein
MDVIYSLSYMEKMAGWGVISEFPWGDTYLGGYIEYCDLGGVYCSQPPLYYAVTGTWDRSTTTGQLATCGPKIVGVKIVGHGPIITGGVVVGGDAVKVYGRVVDSKIGLSEFGSDSYKYDGLSLSGGYGGSAKYGTIVGNTFSSWDNNAGSPDNNAILLGENALANAIVGNTIRQDATTGPYRGIDAKSGSGYNVIADNVLSSPTGTIAQRDVVGWNQYTNNLNVQEKEQWRFVGVVSDTWDGTSIAHTYDAPLVTVPSGADLIATITPRDIQTGAKAWAVTSVTAATLTIESSNASAGTTLGADITADAVNPQSVLVGDSSMYLVGGYARIGEGTGTAEDVLVTAIADGTHITGIFTQNHTNGDEADPIYRFYARVEIECRQNGNA